MGNKFLKVLAFQCFIPYGFLLIGIGHTYQVVGVVVQLAGLYTLVLIDPFNRTPK